MGTIYPNNEGGAPQAITSFALVKSFRDWHVVLFLWSKAQLS